MQRGILNVTLEKMLTDVVIASWYQLVENSTVTDAHLEYHRSAPDKSLEYVKLWAADQHGGWDLMCQYWVCDSPNGTGNGLKFNAPFRSQIFERFLPTVLQDQDTFSDLEDQNRDGLIQIHAPTEEDTLSAYSALQDALADRHGENRESVKDESS